MSEDLKNKEIIFSEQDTDTDKVDNNDSESIVDTNILRPKSFDEYVGQEKIIQFFAYFEIFVQFCIHFYIFFQKLTLVESFNPSLAVSLTDKKNKFWRENVSSEN